MQKFYGRAGFRYLKRLVLAQSLFFGMLLLGAIDWTLDRFGVLPGTPWTLYASLWLVLAALAAWLAVLLHALPNNDFVSPRRARQLVIVVSAGAILSSVLGLALADREVALARLLAVSPALVAALAACGVSFVYVRRLLAGLSKTERRYDADRTNLDSLRKRFGAAAVARIELSHALELGKAAGNPAPGPRGYVIPGLTSKPIYNSVEFEWTRGLEQSYREIRREAEDVLTNRSLLSPYSYLNQAGWNACRFVERYRVNEDVCRRFPRTAELLATIPHYPRFRDAMFSVLDPNTHLPAHRDGSNVYLTCHLGLVIPENCGIRIGGQPRAWTEGKCLIFDSSYEHEAWNADDSARIVLLVDFLHPELNEAEAEWVAARDADIPIQPNSEPTGFRGKDGLPRSHTERTRRK